MNMTFIKNFKFKCKWNTPLENTTGDFVFINCPVGGNESYFNFHNDDLKFLQEFSKNALPNSFIWIRETESKKKLIFIEVQGATKFRQILYVNISKILMLQEQRPKWIYIKAEELEVIIAYKNNRIASFYFYIDFFSMRVVLSYSSQSGIKVGQKHYRIKAYKGFKEHKLAKLLPVLFSVIEERIKKRTVPKLINNPSSIAALRKAVREKQSRKQYKNKINKLHKKHTVVSP